MHRAFFSILIAISGRSVLAAAQADNERLFRERVAPVLECRCLSCHHGADAKGELSFESSSTALAGGASGPSIVAGHPEESLLLDYISGDEPAMPESGPPLTPTEIEDIRTWIAAGAPWPDGLILQDQRFATDWWSLRPLEAPPEPNVGSDWVRNPIDAFVLARLHGTGLEPSTEADRRTLIRRLYFDLLGLPPSAEAVADFIADESPNAYERLVDTLLETPHYGERWARHWLDVVHFGESHGFDKDKPRPNAWPYRDYVIQSLNDDKPYTRFVEEQLAGDVLYRDDPQGIVATGFIAAGPWDFVGHVELREGTKDKRICRSLDRDDMVATAMSTFTSMTVHCARCHDHKFDPIPQRDYYRLQAVFAGVERADREFDKDPEIGRRRVTVYARIAALKSAREIRKEDSSGEELSELTSLDTEINQLEAELKALPPISVVYAASNRFTPVGSFSPPNGAREIHLLARGNVDSPIEVVSPGTLSCVPGLDPDFQVDPSDNEGLRRAALAAWITDRDNTLTWRSIVNRVWLYHFGEGLVDTPNDFGRMGNAPSHPELLDWLAVWFRDQGQSLKALHRLIVTSATYRQASADNPRAAAIDGSNRLLWRMNRRRLEAEAVRDAVLLCSGKLDLTMGGPSVRQYLFEDDHSPRYDYVHFDVDDPAMYRRSVYRFLIRSVPDPFMERLDCADPSLIVPKRNTTLTAIQALALLNNPFMVRQAEHFAARIESSADTPSDQVEQAWRIAFGRPPTGEERAAMFPFVKNHGLPSMCRVIFNMNEFLFVD